MSIELLSDEHWTTLINTIDNTQKYIKIISPFIGFKTAQLLKKYISDSKIECTIITRFYREDFLNNASSLEGLKELVKCGANIYALQDLHTKLYLFDESVSIVGSANFTMGGFKLNHELSLIIIDEDDISNEFNKYFDEMLIEIKRSGDWLIELKRIEDEIIQTDNIIKNRKDKNVKYSNTIKFGAKIKNITMNEENDFMEGIIRLGSSNERDDAGVWLKFEGTGEERIESNSKYNILLLGLDKKKVTCFPRNPRGIMKNDYIYLAAISCDKNNVATPMIVARARTKGFNINNFASKGELDSIDWLSDYPYYCELFNIEIINTEVKNCISLNSVIKEVGCDLYPNTVGKNVTIQEIKIRHHQKSHIRITNVAKDFIDYKFNELKKKYGVISR